MHKILSVIFAVILGFSLGYGGTALAASVYSAGSLLQVGDVKSSHIFDGTIQNVDISNNAAIDATKIKGGTAGTVMMANGTRLATTTNLSFATSTNKLSVVGQLSVSASTTFSGIEYLWPSNQGASSTAPMTDGAGHISWNLPTIAASFPTFTTLTATSTYGTYTTPAGVSALYIRMCGGGGNGGDSTGQASSGGTALFGTGTASTTALGGIGGTNTNLGGLGGYGGTTSIGTTIQRLQGNGGATGATGNGSGSGGASLFGGAARGGNNGTGYGTAATMSSCSGGSGVPTATASGGGGAGENIDFIITNPAATYRYYLNPQTAPVNGGLGGDPRIFITEYYH